MAAIDVGQVWVGNVDGTKFEIIAVGCPPLGPSPRPHWVWRTEDGQTGTASSALITHACTLATD